MQQLMEENLGSLHVHVYSYLYCGCFVSLFVCLFGRIFVSPHTLVMRTDLKTETKAKTIEQQKKNKSAYMYK